MPRPARSALVALPLLALLAGCGSQEASQSSVRDKVEDGLLAEESEFGGTAAEAASVAECVSRSMFESEAFTKDERQDAASAVDGDPPSSELEAKVVALFEDCGIGSGADGDGDGDESAAPDDGACLAAFEDAVAVDELEDSVEDYYPTLTACESLDEWATSAEDAGARVDFDAPAETVAELCDGAGESSALCDEAAGEPG